MKTRSLPVRSAQLSPPPRVSCTRLGATALSLLLLGCTTPGMAPIPMPEPTPLAEEAAASAEAAAREAYIPPAPTLSPRTLDLPERAPRPPAMRLLEATNFTLLVHEASLRSVLLGLGRESPLNIVIDPDVDGFISADLADVSMLEILDELVIGRGYRYAVNGNTLRIFREDRGTRSYFVDYPSYTRKGETHVALSGFLGSGLELEGAGAESNDTSLAQINTSQTNDLWSEIERAVRTIVFGSADDEREEAVEAEENEDGSPTAASLLPSRRVIVSRQAGLVTVTAESTLLDEVDNYLRAVAETQQRQVLIDAQIIEVLLKDELDLGVDWEGAPNLGSETVGTISRMIIPGLREASLAQSLAPVLSEGGFEFGIAREDFGVALRALAKQTDVRVVSTPRISTLNNHKAMIKVVRNEVFYIGETETILTDQQSQTTTDYTPAIIPVGVTLDVTPQISADNKITLHIRPSFSEIVSVELQPALPGASQQGSLPVVDVRETDAVLRVDDGSTLVLGGLIQSREFELERKVPFLGDVPWLGAAFRSTTIEESRTELIILLTPTILDAPRIARVTDDLMSSLEGGSEIARNRSVRPWWRRPLGKSYGALQ